MLQWSWKFEVFIESARQSTLEYIAVYHHDVGFSFLKIVINLGDLHYFIRTFRNHISVRDVCDQWILIANMYGLVINVGSSAKAYDTFIVEKRLVPTSYAATNLAWVTCRCHFLSTKTFHTSLRHDVFFRCICTNRILTSDFWPSHKSGTFLLWLHLKKTMSFWNLF